MSKSITAVNVKLIANGQGMITEFKRAEAAASGAARKIDGEMDKLARAVKKKFSGSSIGKDLLSGLGLGGGAAVAFTAANFAKGMWDDRQNASKEHEASLARQAALTEEIYRVNLTDAERLAALRQDEAEAFKRVQAAQATPRGLTEQAKLDELIEKYQQLALEVKKAEVEVGKVNAAIAEEDRARLAAAGLNANGTRSTLRMDAFGAEKADRTIAEMRAQADQYSRQLYNGPEGLAAGTPEFIKEQLRVAGLYQQTLANIDVATERHAQHARQYAEVIAGGFEEAIFSGEKLGDVLKNLAQDLLRLVFNQTITAPLAGFLTSGLAGIMGKASGGPVMGGTPYMVGERGPELFVPSAGGSIVPNHALGGGGNVYQIDARGTDEGVVQRLQAALLALAGPGVVERRALAAHSGTLRRGGGAARALGA